MYNKQFILLFFKQLIVSTIHLTEPCTFKQTHKLILFKDIFFSSKFKFSDSESLELISKSKSCDILKIKLFFK